MLDDPIGFRLTQIKEKSKKNIYIFQPKLTKKKYLDYIIFRLYNLLKSYCSGWDVF